jgi:hypothetical protein
MKNHRKEAKQVITRLYGEEHVHTALGLLKPKKQLDETEAGYSTEPAESIWSPKNRMQFLGALLMSCTQQLSGINAVFYHSGDIFLDAGIDDSCRNAHHRLHQDLSRLLHGRAEHALRQPQHDPGWHDRRLPRRRLGAPGRTASSRTISRCGHLYRQRSAQAKRGLLLMAQKMLFLELQRRARDRDAVLIVSLRAPRRTGVIQRVLSALLELDPRRLQHYHSRLPDVPEAAGATFFG